MNFLFILLFSYVAAEFDGVKCFSAFNTILEVTTLTQEDLANTCPDPDKKAKAVEVLKDIVEQCGLTGWNERASTRREKKIGSLVNGLFNYTEELLCLKKDNFYCFPGAIKILDVDYLVKFFIDMNNQIEDGKEPDLSKLDLKCTVLQRPDVLSAICPGGAKDSPKRWCQEEMIFQFQIAVLKIKKALKVLMPDMDRSEIKELTQPLRNIAKDVKKICNKRKRKATNKFFKKHCVDGTEVTDAPGCINPNSITDDCLRSEICNIDVANPGCNSIKRGVAATLIDTRDTLSSLKAQIVLPDDTILDLDRADNLCCNAECKEKMTSCPYWQTAQMEFELSIPGFDLKNYIDSCTPAQLQELGQKICESKGAVDGTFNITSGCQVEFYEVPQATQRRLFDTTTSIGVRMSVNSTDPEPLSCEADGSLEAFDDALAQNNANISSVSRLDTDQCNCTVGKCDEPDYTEPTDGPIISSESPIEPTSPSNSTDNSVSTSHSASFATILLLCLFVKNASDL